LQQAAESGALSSLLNALTLSAFLNGVHQFGGEIGAAFRQRLVAVGYQFHLRMLGPGFQSGDWLTDERLRLLTGGSITGSSGVETGGHLRLKCNEHVMEFLLDQLGEAGYQRSFVKAMVERQFLRPLLQLIFTGQIKEVEVLFFDVTDDRKKLYFRCPRGHQSVKPALL